MKKNKYHQAYTLVEILSAIAVIGVLISIVTISYSSWRNAAYVNSVKSDARNVASAMENAKNFSSAGYPVTASEIFKASSNVNISGGSSDNGVSFCIDITHKKDLAIKYYIDSVNKIVLPGSCASRTEKLTAPTNLVAMANSISSISLMFDTVPGATGYNIQRSSNASFTDAITITKLGASPVLPYISDSLSENTIYYYRVQAITNLINSNWSALATAITNNSTIAVPDIPTVTQSSNSISTTYTRSDVTCSAGYNAKYQYNYSIMPDGYSSGWRNLSNDQRLITFTTVSGDMTYSLDVRAQCYKNFSSSEWSNWGSISYTRPGPPKPPTLANCSATDITNFSATLCANISSPGDSPVTDSGICWGLSSNPSSNCISEYSSGLTWSTKVATSTYVLATNCMAISPDGKSVYVGYPGSSGAAGVGVFNRDTSTGALTWSTKVSTSTYVLGINSIVVSPDGKSVYVGYPGSSGAAGVGVFNRDTSTGALTWSTKVATSTYVLATNSISVSPDNKSVYVGYPGSSGAAGVGVFNRDTSTGALTWSTRVATSTYILATNCMIVSPDGKSVYVGYQTSSSSAAGIGVFNRDISTGAITWSAKVPTSTYILSTNSITISPDGKSVYVGYPYSGSDPAGVGAYVRNPSTGALTWSTKINTLNFVLPTNSISVSPDGKSVYVGYPSSGSDPAGVGIFNRDISNGDINWSSRVSTSTYVLGVTSIVISPDGKSLYVSYPASSGYAGVGVFNRTRVVSYPNIVAYLVNLPANTKIYFRGFATNSVGTAYSADNSFMTL